MLSDRVASARESITLKLNAKAEELKAKGEQIDNLTAGQLPFPPDERLSEGIVRQLKELKSFQYSPVPGFPALRKKAMKYVEDTRGITLDGESFDCVVSTGAKQSLFNLIAAIVDPGDEVIILSPYWVSYPEIIRYWQGKPVAVGTSEGNLAEGPAIADIARAITSKTKAIMLNTPGNPSGVYYRDEWMKEFAQLMVDHPQVQIISDEIYSQLYYIGDGPKFPYHFRPELLERTFIVDGISKSMACTGLRIGFSLGNKRVMGAMAKVQGQSTSGACSLVQKALMEYDFAGIQDYLTPIKKHLHANSAVVKEKLEQYGLGSAWYQINGAFYFFMSFAGHPILEKLQGEGHSVTGGDFGGKNLRGSHRPYGSGYGPRNRFWPGQRSPIEPHFA